MPKVEMYATAVCPYCVRARQRLERNGIEYDEIRIDRDRGQRKTMIERSKRATVPQIFVGDRHVGGYEDIARLEASGKLDALLEQ